MRHQDYMCMCEITRDHFWLHVSLAVATVFPRRRIENATWWQRWDTTPRPRETEMASLRVTPPEPFDFTTPDEWPKWSRRFQRFRIASGLASGDEETQVNTLIYCMGDKADDILRSFQRPKTRKITRPSGKNLTASPEKYYLRARKVQQPLSGAGRTGSKLRNGTLQPGRTLWIRGTPR